VVAAAACTGIVRRSARRTIIYLLRKGIIYEQESGKVRVTQTAEEPRSRKLGRSRSDTLTFLSDFMHPDPTNKRVKVSGTLEMDKNGFLELYLFDEKDGQVVHSHRYPAKTPHWDFWLYPGKKDGKKMAMTETVYSKMAKVLKRSMK